MVINRSLLKKPSVLYLGYVKVFLMLIFKRTKLFKKIYRASFVMPCLVSTNLNHFYLIILLKFFFTYFAATFLYVKRNFFLRRTWRTLFTSFALVPAFLGWCNYMEKNYSWWETGFFICKSEFLVMKNLPLGQDNFSM